MMNKVRWVLSLAWVLAFFATYGQNINNHSESRDKRHIDQSQKRVYWGGGFGFSTGNSRAGQYMNLALNPIVGYRVTDDFSMGTGVNWDYVKYNDADISISQYGISPFARYNFNELFGYGEYNITNTPRVVNSLKVDRQFFQRLLIGLGYSKSLGQRGAINVMALYDVMYNRRNGAFASPWVYRVFFTL